MSRAMKDSGVAWIGEIPEAWKIGKTSLFFDIQLGKMLQPEASSDTDSNEYYLCAANLGGNELKMNPLRQMWFSSNDKEQFAVKKGDLLVVEGGDVASCDIVREEVHDLYIQNALHRVRSKNGSSVEYLRYLLMIAKARGHIDLICNKATIAHFTKDKFGSLPFIVASVAEQSRIAAHLDRRCAEIDRVIAATQRTIEEYKKLKQSIITEAVTHGVSGPRKMKDSRVEWIGEIPEEWSISRIRFIGQVKTGPFGTQLSAEEYSEEGIPIINVKNIGSGYIRYEELDRIPDGVAERLEEHKLCLNDIVFARKGSIDKHAIIREENAGWVQGSDCIRLRLVADILAVYMNYYLESAIIKDYLWTASNGATMASLNSEMIENIYIVVPTKTEQSIIVRYLNDKCSQIDNLIEAKQQLLTQLESYKKSVIYEYVTGKREVPECQ